MVGDGSGSPVARSLRVAVASVLATASALLAACGMPAPADSGAATSSPFTPPPSTSPSTSASPSGPASAGDFAGLITVGSRKLYLECRGSGSPTVILQSGFGNGADIWSWSEAKPPPVYPGTAEFARVCAYDRPGSIRSLDDAGKPTELPRPGRSDPAPMPRTGAVVVTELHDLLIAAGVPGPYVLVGHSLGGLFQLQYARTHPDEVAGMVLVDATSPALPSLLSSQLRTDFLVDPLLHPQSPIAGYAIEAYDIDETLAQLEAAGPVPRVPAAVLAAAGLQPGVPPAMAKALGPILPKAQAALAASIPGSTLTTVPKTTHYIQLERPDVVIMTIKKVRS